MAVRIAGIAFLKVDGNQYPLRGNFVISPSAVVRAGIAGQDYVHGFSELPRVPYIEGDVSMVPQLLAENVEAITNATVTCEAANGNVYVLKEAWSDAGFELNTHDGSFKVKFEGTSCTEIQGAAA